LSRSGRAPRQRSRSVALQALYAEDLAEAGKPDRSACVEEVFERVAQNFDLPTSARDFALDLFTGTASHLAEIDALLSENAVNWKISRMAAVDRNVLRLAIYELTRTETPTSVVLDEAIQLARRFGAESSPAFVNGVLDAVARQVRPEFETDTEGNAAATGRGERRGAR
jgi:N utilization substance protein B